MASSPRSSADPQETLSIPSSWPVPPLSSAHHFETHTVLSASSDETGPLPPMSQIAPLPPSSSSPSTTTTTTTTTADNTITTTTRGNHTSGRYHSHTRSTSTGTGIGIDTSASSRTDDKDDAQISDATAAAVPPPPPTPPAPPVDTSASTSTTPRSSVHQIKRKPLTGAAATFAARFSQASSSTASSSYIDLPTTDHRFERDASAQDSPTLYEYPEGVGLTASQPRPSEARFNPDDVGPTPETRDLPDDEYAGSGSQFDVLSVYDDLLSDHTSEQGPGQQREDRHDRQPTDAASTPRVAADERRGSSNSNLRPEAVSTDDDDDEYESAVSDHIDRRESSSPMRASKPTPPHLKLQQVDTSIREDAVSLNSDTGTPDSAYRNKRLPKSPAPASPFATFFGWGNQSPGATDFTAATTPQTPPTKGAAAVFPTKTTSALYAGDPRSNDAATGSRNPYLPTSPTLEPYDLEQIEEMEDELKSISSELAASIRREMDLEDLVDRLQEQASNAQAASKRTSDYFSDSGYSSAKASETENGREEIEKIQRRSEQEKASIKLELTNKLQEERLRRKDLDLKIKQLAERASHVDLAQMNNLDANERMRELEESCEDLRRRLVEERSSKDNFEDLLSALRGELQGACNERDNLRDEVVPQLRARVEGLEAEAAEYANLTYESTKMQQELETLKGENSSLRRGSVMGENVGLRRGSVLGDITPKRGSVMMASGLSRSNSVAAGGMRGRSGGMGLSRSNSVKTGQVESREALAERLKDVEVQRDALHSALKNLLERQFFQSRDYEKRIRSLEAERDRLMAGPAKRGGFEREILNLRTEVNLLRRRAEDALEQKWQVEKGLSGLKMDLDRAEGEIASLRELLDENDILIPTSFARSSVGSAGSDSPVSSASLREAYRKLQTLYTESLQRIKDLESGLPPDEETRGAMERLERALSLAVAERDAVSGEMEALAGRYDDLSADGGRGVEAQRSLSDELTESARQVERLASQVQRQLAANADLRTRLADAVARGDADRHSNNNRITFLMERLRGLEDDLVTAQTASEDTVARHEEEIGRLHEAQSSALHRVDGLVKGGAALRSPRSPLARRGPSAFPGSPRLTEASFEDEAEMKSLRAKVGELEKALAEAETEMQDVITRMSTAQVEVLNLQEERDAAVRETRRLQKSVEASQAPAEGRFKVFGF
ncbi:Chromosome segregation ATPase [Geosmithia morbida]|uniref:Chromosome segregation ATPase n=1 Tax=Geosmithia morbida TaxID=1094350 RepID=A0A9P4YYN1_9HYPO|nr:Chromosome segregation ATPase [Geosmithia morbida]KAF4123419.1 Chromosome segregation ATPase [Geosmithia morbida]